MPTIFEQIDTSLAGIDLDVSVSVQVDGVNAIDGNLIALIQNPPTELDDLLAVLGQLNLPDTNQLGDLGNVINALKDLVPEDLEGLAGSLETGLDGLIESIGGDIFAKIEQAMEAYRCLDELIGLITGTVTPTSRSASRSANRALGNLGDYSGGLAFISQQLTQYFPSPMTVESLLEALHSSLAGFPRELIPTRYVPFLDELRQTLDTIMSWRSLSSSQIGSQVETTLSQVASYLNQALDPAVLPYEAQLQQLQTDLSLISLQADIQQFVAELQNLDAAINGADLPGIDAAILALNSLLPSLQNRLQSINSTVFDGQQTAFDQQLHSLSFELEGQMLRVFSELNPPQDSALLGELIGKAGDALHPEQVDRYQEGLNTFFSWFKGVLEQIDLSSIEQPIGDAATTASGVVDSLDDAMLQISSQVSVMFDEVDTLLDQVDTTAITTAIEQAIQDFEQEVQQQIDNLFGPVRSAIQDALNLIDGAVDDFDPEAILDALREAIQALTGVLSDPSILNALGEIKSTLESAVEELNQLSFTPVNDAVVGQIDEVTATLNTIDPDELSTELKLALSAALALLPGEDFINQLKDELIQRFEDMVQLGPVALVELIKDQPAKLRLEVDKFAPVNLIGDELSAPFQQLLSKLEAFVPSSLLKPLEDELTKLRGIVAEQANPAQFFAPLEALYDQLLQAFEKLRPSDLIAPLQQKITDLINQLLEAATINDFMDLINNVMGQVQQIISFPGTLQTFLQEVSTLLNGLSDPATQLDSWLNGVLSSIDSLPNSIALQARMQQIGSSIDTLRGQAIETRILPALDALVLGLDTLNPQQQLNDIIRLVRDMPSAAIVTLPAPQRTAVETFLGSFSPLDAAFSGPLNRLNNWLEALRPRPQALRDFLSGWDTKYLSANSPLFLCLPASLDLSGLQAMLRATIEQDLRTPILALLELLEPLKNLVDTMLTEFSFLLLDLQTQLFNIIDGPNSLTTIQQSINDLVDRIQNFDLGFLVNELEAIFDGVKLKLEAISPTVLKGLVDTAFNSALDNLSLTTLIPTAQIEGLDATFESIIDKFRLLDPQRLVVEILQPEFEALIGPYLDAFDLGPCMEDLLARLSALDEELDVELQRAVAAFVAMLAAVPTIDILSIDINIDIGF
ncbi:MAG: hypothetical protein AAGI38_06085 [Bacteroidota bacterium]